MVIILKAKLKEQCEVKKAYIDECENLTQREWELTAYMYKYEKEETIEKLLKLTDKHQNIYINSSVLGRKSVVREEEGSKHTYYNHYDPVTGELFKQIKKYKNPKHQRVGDDKPMYYTMRVGYTKYKRELEPFLKTEFTKRDLGCVKSATSMFNFTAKPVRVEKKVEKEVVGTVVEEKRMESKKVKKVMIDDDPVLPNEPQYNPVTKKSKKVKKVLIDDDPVLPNEPQYNSVTKKSSSLKQQLEELHKTMKERIAERLDLIMKTYNDYDEIESLDKGILTQDRRFYKNARDIRMNGVVNDNYCDIYWELIVENSGNWNGIVLSKEVREYIIEYIGENEVNTNDGEIAKTSNDANLIYMYSYTPYEESEYCINLVKNYVYDDGLPFVLK